MMNEQLMRTFLAAELPQEVRRHIGRLQENLKTTLRGVRWVRPEGMHLTLKFFGDVSAADIERIEKTVKTHTEKASLMTFSLGTLGAFPTLARPRVLWLGMEGDKDRLAELQRAIETDLDALGFPKESRSFTPHLTLGRLKLPGRETPGIDSALKHSQAPERQSFSVNELTLLKSDLKPGGAVYTKLAGFPFGV